MSGRNSLLGWLIVGFLVLVTALVLLAGLYRGTPKRAAAPPVTHAKPAVTAQQAYEQKERAREARERELLERIRSLEEMARDKKRQEEINRELATSRAEADNKIRRMQLDNDREQFLREHDQRMKAMQQHYGR